MARDEAKWAYWGKHVKDWRASGITRHSYCRREGLKPTTFDYWRPLISLDRPEVKPQKPSVTSKRVTLVPVTVIDRPRDAAREFSPVKDALILKSPSGWQVQLSAQTDPNWLINVLRQLP